MKPDSSTIASSRTEAPRRDDGRRVPATEHVLDHILSEMDAGRLAPGSRVNAAKIANQLGLSAAPVREALSVLAGRGVIDLLPERGAVMRPITANEVCQLWDVVAAIGAVGVSLAAQAVADGADTAEIVEYFDAIRNYPTGGSQVGFLLRLNEYHFAANRFGGNAFVSAGLDRLGVPYWDRYLAAFIDIHANINGYIANYTRLHQAILAGDARGAAAVMHYHAAWSVRLIRQRQHELEARPRGRRAPRAREAG